MESLIEIAEEDDSLIQHSPDLHQTPSKSSLSYSTFALPPSHAKNLKDGVRMEKPSSSSTQGINNKENINSSSVEVPKLGMEPMQMKRRKKGAGYNLRKSLAWDRAFFTDEGILDPLELTMITGVDANTCGGGLSAISEEENTLFSPDVRCRNESNDMEASEKAPLKELCDMNRTPKEKRDKIASSMRNHSVTHKVLSCNRTDRGGSKVGGCSEPLAASSLKRPANSNTLKTAKKESKLPKLPASKPGSCLYATTKVSMAASQLRHNLIPKPTINIEKNFGLKSSLQNVHGSHSKAKRGSGNLQLPVKERAQKTVKNLTPSSKAASSTKSRLVQPIQFDKSNSQSEMAQDTLQLCKVQKESASHAPKHLIQHAAANSNNTLPEAARLTSSGPCHIRRASKDLMISDRSHPFESQDCPAVLAQPSGLRLPSPSLRLFDQVTSSESTSMQHKRIQQYMGSDRKFGVPQPSTILPMKSNGITENICSVRTSSKECCAPSTQLSPSPNYTLNTSIKGVQDSNTYQNLAKVVPRVHPKLEYECRGPEQEKRILGHEETAATWKGDEGIKVSNPTEQLIGIVGTCCQLMSESRVPETKYKPVLLNKEDGLQTYSPFSMSKFGQSIQHQEETISTGVAVLAQTSWEQVDTEKSDDASPKVNPESHLDAGSQMFMESHEQDEIREIEDDVGTTKCVAPDIKIYSVVLRQENKVSKVVDDKSLPVEEDDSPCRIGKAFEDSHSLEDEAGVIKLKDLDTSCVLFQHMNTEQINDDADSVVVFPCTTTTTTSPQVEIISETASLGDDTLVKRESVLQGAHCTSIYPQNMEKESLDVAAPTVEVQLNIPKENHKGQEMGITFVAEKSHESCGSIPEAEPAVQGSTDGLETCNQFQSENQTLEGSGPISNIFKTNVKDGQVQLLDDAVLVQSCSRLPSEVHNESIENAYHSDILRKQAGFSNTGIKLERVSQSNENYQQEPVCKVVWNAVEGNEVYECDPRSPNTIIVDVPPPVVEEAGNSDMPLCVDYRTSSSTVIDLIAEHNENYSDGQSAECGDLTATHDVKLEQPVKDKVFAKNSSCMEYCTAGEESCSFASDSMLEEKISLSLDDQVLMNENYESLLCTEKILDSVIVPEENSDASAQNLPMVHVNGDDQPQDFVGIMPSVETCDSFTNGQSHSSFSVSQQPTAGVQTTSTPELCCLVGGGDESLLTKTTYMIGDEGSNISIGEQVDANPMVSEFEHDLDDLKGLKNAAILTKRSNSIKRQEDSLVIHPPNAVPFSDEWLAAFEAAGEEILTMKCGAVQHSPPDKSLPEPSPWSPVKKKANQIGPYDCTKYTNAMPSNSQ